MKQTFFSGNCSYSLQAKKDVKDKTFLLPNVQNVI